MQDTNRGSIAERPQGACSTCPPPRKNAWRQADRGYKTCSDCYDDIREHLLEIARRFTALDATPGASGDLSGRGAPGFGSRPAASPHIIAMTDWRSKSCEVAFDGVLYRWDPLADTVLEPGQYGPPAGAYTERREVWFGRDGRGHSEQEHPPRSVPLALSGIAAMIAEERDMTPPLSRQVPELVRWIDGQMDWLTRQDLVVDVREDLSELARQLRPVTGEPGKAKVGDCPNVIDDNGKVCGASLRAPTAGDTIRCRVCGREWERPEWEHLGRMLQQQRAEARTAS